MQHQLWCKAFRQMQINSRFLIIILLLNLFLVIFFIAANKSALKVTEKHTELHKYLKNLFKKTANNNDISADADELIWSNETVELFQDQLGLTLLTNESDDETKVKCENVFMLSALPGSEEDNFYESIWQWFSLDSLEHMTIICDDSGKKLTLRAVVTERMKFHLETIFEGLPLDMIKSYPSSCYKLLYSKIIGNTSPIELKEIEKETPFLLNPATKRWREISQRWAIKVKPYWKFKASVLKEIEPEFTITKTLIETEASRDNDINYVGVYIKSDDKLPAEYYQQAIAFHRKNSLAVFIVICEIQSLTMCHDLFENVRNPQKDDARVLRTSTNAFDFALMSSCNSTIVSNEMGVLHALMNGGVALVYHHPDAEHYVPYLMSEQMENWYAINVLSSQ